MSGCSIVRLSCHPVLVVALVPAAELLVGLGLLRTEYLVDILVLVVGEFDVPIDEFLVKLDPLGWAEQSAKFHTYLAELLLIGDGRLLIGEALGLGVFFHGQQYLFRVDRFDEVVAYFAADGLVHDMLLLAFGYHYDGERWVAVLYLCQCVETAEARHILVEKDDVKSVP